MGNEDQADKPSLTIGAVSRATEVPSNTLRTWERRYGFPRPRRSAGGQRLYDPAVVPRLRLIGRALKKGHRPGQIMTLSDADLRALVDPLPDVWSAPTGSGEWNMAAWMSAVEDLDGPSFEALLESDASSMGLLRFVSERVGPFAHAVGERWLEGELEVFQEHFASQRLVGFLTRQWRSMSDLNTGPAVLCSTLPGERHILGLHMAACVLALYGGRIVFLGDDAPEADIAEAARQSGSVAVAVSVSVHTHQAGAEAQLTSLRRQLPEQMPLLVGGQGAPRDVEGATRLPGLEALAEWCQRRLAS